MVPHTAIDTEAGWPKRGGPGWGSGWKLPLVTTVAAGWIPLAADLTPANVADNEHAPGLVADLPAALRFLLGDTSSNAPDLPARGAAAGRVLVATRRGAYPHRDDGARGRQVVHALRSHAIETFNEQFKAIFGGHGQVPARGLGATRRSALGASLVYQLTLLPRFRAGRPLRVGRTPVLHAA